MSRRGDALREAARRDLTGFWSAAARGIDWIEPPRRILDDGNPPFYRWFTGGVLNTCYNAVDRHVEAGKGNDTALIYDSPVTDSHASWTFSQLQAEVAQIAGALSRAGLRKGDTVVLYLPMVPEAVFAMLACARIGAIHSVVFGGFAAPELASRIDDCRPRVVLSASCGIEVNRIVEYKPMLDEALNIARHEPEQCIILQREAKRASLTAGRDVDWREFVDAAQPHECVAVESEHPLYILYTSGTTGKPKGVVRDNGGHAVALAWSMPNIYGVGPGETYWAASDIGWVVGHSYIVYAPLLNGNATVLYEGKPVGTPDAGAFWRVVSEHDVSVMFTAPTALRAIRREDPAGEKIRRNSMHRLRALFLAGERTDPATLDWAREMLDVPVVDHWWQTETGWPITANLLGLDEKEIRAGSAGRPVPGMEVCVLDEHGQELRRGETGALAVRLPLPPGTLLGLWEAEERCRESYFAEYPGFYKTADAGTIDADGYVHVMSRTDDVINVAGHRLSTGAMEEVLASHPDIAECAVCGVGDALKGQVPIGLLVPSSGSSRSHEALVTETVALVREKIGPVAAFKQAAVVARLPKTRSGKVLRGTIAKIADGQPWQMPATIDDPAILAEIEAALAALGFPHDPADTAK
jgi:propionyl-CoA synthetase